MASAYVLKFPHVWLVSFPLCSSGVGDREEGIVLNVKGDAIVIYNYKTDVLVEKPLETRIMKIKPVDIAAYLPAIKACFINNYDMNVNTERLLRLYIADIEAKIATKKAQSLESKEVYSSEDNGGSEESDDDEEYDDSEEEEREEEEKEESESESESEEEESEESDASSSSSSSSSEDEDEDNVDFKVVIESPNMEPEVRGFCMSKRKIIKKVSKTLQADYGSKPILYFCDTDGDQIQIKRYSDIRFALKSHSKHLSASQTGSDNFPLLRLNARMGDADLPLMSTLALTNSQRRGEHKQDLQGAYNVGAASATMEGDVLLQDEQFHWQKGELVGAGSFGQVYGGILTQSGKRIAVKEVLLSGTKGHIEQAKAMQVEIQILSTLEHPNIIKYLGAEFTKTTLRIFLDLASEGSLKDILNEFGGLSEPLLRKYMHDILTGLNFLHSKGIIHRDIKPSNLLLDKGIVKLADFGCSATVNLTGENGKSELQHDTVIGTGIYMSPEIMRGDEKSGVGGYGRKTDIWSLGITFCEMATAQSPFKNAAAAIYAVCVSKEYPHLPDDISEDGTSFLARCLFEDPNFRADTNELLAHPFCIDQLQCATLRSLPDRKSHTLSSVALLPDFNIIGNLEYNPRIDPDCGNCDSNEDADDSFFEHKSQRNSTKRGAGREDNIARDRDKGVEEYDAQDFGSDDDTMFG